MSDEPDGESTVYQRRGVYHILRGVLMGEGAVAGLLDRASANV